MKKAILTVGLFLIGNEVISLVALFALGCVGVVKLFSVMAERGVY